MAVADVVGPPARPEVDETVAVDVLDERTLRLDRHEQAVCGRPVGPRRHELDLFLDESLGFGTRERRSDE